LPPVISRLLRLTAEVNVAETEGNALVPGRSLGSRSFLGGFFSTIVAATASLNDFLTTALLAAETIAEATEQAVATLAATAAAIVARAVIGTIATVVATATVEQAETATVALGRAVIVTIATAAVIGTITALAAMATMTGDSLRVTTEQCQANYGEKHGHTQHQCTIHL
jgi:hypothetical protein